MIRWAYFGLAVLTAAWVRGRVNAYVRAVENQAAAAGRLATAQEKTADAAFWIVKDLCLK